MKYKTDFVGIFIIIIIIFLVILIGLGIWTIANGVSNNG